MGSIEHITFTLQSCGKCRLRHIQFKLVKETTLCVWCIRAVFEFIIIRESLVKWGEIEFSKWQHNELRLKNWKIKKDRSIENCAIALSIHVTKPYIHSIHCYCILNFWFKPHKLYYESLVHSLKIKKIHRKVGVGLPTIYKENKDNR